MSPRNHNEWISEAASRYTDGDYDAASAAAQIAIAMGTTKAGGWLEALVNQGVFVRK